MTTKSSSMTICAGSDTKRAAKQVMTFFLEDIPISDGNLLICSRTNVNCTLNGCVLQKKKKKRSTPVLLPPSVSGLCLVTHSQACGPLVFRFLFQGCGSGYFSTTSASTPIASASVSIASASTNKKRKNIHCQLF